MIIRCSIAVELSNLFIENIKYLSSNVGSLSCWIWNTESKRWKIRREAKTRANEADILFRRFMSITMGRSRSFRRWMIPLSLFTHHRSSRSSFSVCAHLIPLGLLVCSLSVISCIQLRLFVHIRQRRRWRWVEIWIWDGKNIKIISDNWKLNWSENCKFQDWVGVLFFWAILVYL